MTKKEYTNQPKDDDIVVGISDLDGNSRICLSWDLGHDGDGFGAKQYASKMINTWWVLGQPAATMANAVLMVYYEVD